MDNKKRHDNTVMDMAFAYGTATLGGLFVMVLVLFFTDIGISGAVAIGLVLGAIAAWILHRSMVNSLPAPNAASAPQAATPGAPQAATPGAPEPAPTPEGPATPGQTVSSGTILPGEQDLASRKGDWKYEGDRSGDASATPPQLLDGPRDGAKDDLQQIRGIGPKLEEMLNAVGVYHYDQIASWSSEEMAWVEAQLEGFKGRVDPGDWVAQARALAGH